jgi:hypothetical protein
MSNSSICVGVILSLLLDRVVASWAAGTARSRACVAIACMRRAQPTGNEPWMGSRLFA